MKKYISVCIGDISLGLWVIRIIIVRIYNRVPAIEYKIMVGVLEWFVKEVMIAEKNKIMIIAIDINILEIDLPSPYMYELLINFDKISCIDFFCEVFWIVFLEKFTDIDFVMTKQKTKIIKLDLKNTSIY